VGEGERGTIKRRTPKRENKRRRTVATKEKKRSTNQKQKDNLHPLRVRWKENQNVHGRREKKNPLRGGGSACGNLRRRYSTKRGRRKREKEFKAKTTKG